MKQTGAPAWLTWALVGGLAAVHAGERIVPHMAFVRLLLTGGGLLLVAAVTLRRAAAWWSASGDARAVERLFLLCYAGCLLALVGFLAAGDAGMALGLGGGDFMAASRLRTVLLVLSGTLLSVALLPALAAQWALGFGPALMDQARAVDHLRVVQVAAAGLTIGLAAPALMLVGYVARERDATLDVSYFRTSSPGESSRAVVGSLNEPLQVLLFFPPVSDVSDQVRGYFRALAASGGDVRVEEYDRLSTPALAQEFGVVRDGTIILALGDRSERIVLPVGVAEARSRLRNLDAEVQVALMRVAREDRMIYMTVGHGELNDPLTATPLDTLGFGSINALRSLIGQLNYRARDLGLESGLGNEVPADAAMVMVLGPRRPFLQAELATLDRYLERGGALLLALEPGVDFDLGPLRERLAIDFHPTPLADDRYFVGVRGDLSDRRLISTDRVSAHDAVATAGQLSVGSALLFMGAGHIVPLDFNRVTLIVESMPNTFQDVDGTFQAGQQRRQSYPLAAAIAGAGGMRALALADSDLFSDFVMFNLGLNSVFVADMLRWLGREEQFSGQISSEADVPMVHTRAENVAWFYSTILGAPLLVLVLGLAGVRVRRRHESGREVGA